MPSPQARCAHALLAALGALACARGAPAIESITLATPMTEGEGWHARGVSVRLDVATTPASVELTVDELTLPAPIGVLRSLRARCDALRLAAGAYACDGASAVVDSRHRSRSELRGRFAFDPGERTFDADVTLRAEDGAPLRVRAALASTSWSIDADADDYSIAALAPWLADLIEWSPDAPPAGTLSLHAHVETRDGVLATLDVRAAVAGMTFSAFEDRLATEALDGELEVTARASSEGFAADVRLRGAGGQLYADPWFVDAGKQPFTANGSGTLALADARLALDLGIDQPGVLRASGSAVIEPEVFRSLRLDIAEARLPDAYAIYLQPLLIGTLLDDLDTAGTARGRIDLDDDGLARVDLALEDAHAEDRNGRFGAYGVSGDLRWTKDAEGAVSALRYGGAALYRIPFDAGSLRVQAGGGTFRLLDTPVRAPLLEGAVVVRTLELRGFGSKDVEVDFDAELEPIEVARLTGALGWVPFAGTLSGRLPTLRYAGGVLTVGGALEAEVFGGLVSIDGVRIEQPLGVLPTLSAEVRMRDIDLERLTSTFSFGHVTGKLHADVLGLQVVDWRAEQFDARIYTPPDDRSRHRISQRAVNSIASLGGGVSAGLQRSLMRVFDEFNYDRIDLRCRMREQVCQMSGVDAAGAGYYILRGKGLPRIDVIGYERAVSWPAFAAGVMNAARSEDVRIE